MNVLLYGNKNSEDVLPVVVNSVLRNTESNVHVRVLSRDWCRDNIYNGRLSVEFIEYYGHSDTPSKQQSSANDVLYYLPHIRDWSRLIMLEWDQLVCGPLDAFYNTEFTGVNYVTAVPYETGKFVDLWSWKGKRNTLRKMYPKEVKCYPGFMGGSHVIDLDKYITSGGSIRMEKALFELGGEDHLAKIGTWAMHTQHVNKVYNSVPESSMEPVITHYYGVNKPWHDSNRSRADLWTSYASSWEELATKTDI